MPQPRPGQLPSAPVSPPTSSPPVVPQGPHPRLFPSGPHPLADSPDLAQRPTAHRAAPPLPAAPRWLGTCLDLACAAVGPFLRSTVTVSQSLSAMARRGRRSVRRLWQLLETRRGNATSLRRLPASGACAAVPPLAPIGRWSQEPALPELRGQSEPGQSRDPPGLPTGGAWRATSDLRH